jgi:hypothetical protein
MAPTTEELAQAVVAETRKRLEESLTKIEHCLSQLDDEQVWWRQSESQNSIGNVILHVCGNLRQWIVSGIGGERDTRHRPSEFSERGPIPTAELLGRLKGVVREACATLSATGPEELLKSRRIQGSDVTGLGAIFDSVPHFVGHTHQIVFITRLQLGDRYEFEWSPSTPEEGAPQ